MHIMSPGTKTSSAETSCGGISCWLSVIEELFTVPDMPEEVVRSPEPCVPDRVK